MCRPFWTPTSHLSTLGRTRLTSPVLPPLQGLFSLPLVPACPPCLASGPVQPATPACPLCLASGPVQPAVATTGAGLLECLSLLPPTSWPFPCAPPLGCKRDAAVISGTVVLENVNLKVSLGWEP